MRLWGRNRQRNDCAGLAIRPGAVSLVTVRDAGGMTPELLGRASVRDDDADTLAEALDGLVDRLDAKGTRTRLVLDESDYQLQMVEAPQVEASELRAAVRWRVKDLIDFHIDDAVFDAFAIPGRAGGEQDRSMMYVAAARIRRVGDLVRQIHRTDLELEVIDIPELAVRNLARLEDADARGIVTLKVGSESGLITLTRQGDLYMSRHLELGASDVSDPGNGRFEDVLLEVQRSMDYYTSHFSQPAPAALTILPTFDGARSLAEWMDDQLDLTVGVFDVRNALEARTEPGSDFAESELLALGAALRREEVRL